MPTITFTRTGQTYEVPAGTSFLEFCRENDAPHDFGCTVGSCGTCVFVLAQGWDNVAPMDDEERETLEMCTDLEHARLGCQLEVRGDITVCQERE